MTDTGSDVTGDGISAATMADNIRVFDFEMLPGREAQKLVFEITPIDPDADVVLTYPRFLRPLGHPCEIWENAQVIDLLWPSGPGLRWGNWIWYDPDAGFQKPPLVAGLGYKSSIIDGLAFKRVFFGGIDAEDDLTAELSSLYDAYEGQSVAVVDKFGLSFLLPKGGLDIVRLALVNSFSEFPPLACFPVKARNTSSWLQTGAYAQEVWDYAQEARYLSGPTDLHLFDGSDAQVSSASGIICTGWKINQYSPALDNTETGWHVKAGATAIGTVRPWHGFFGIYGAPPVTGGTSPSYDVGHGNRHVRAYVGDAIITGYRANHSDWVDTDTGIAGDEPCIRIDRDSKTQLVYLWYHDTATDTIIRVISSDEGRSWSMATTVGSGKQPAAVIGRNGVQYVYWVDGTDVKGTLASRTGSTMVATFVAVSGVDDDGIAVDEWVDSQGVHHIRLLVVIGGTLTQYDSVDGVIFT